MRVPFNRDGKFDFQEMCSLNAQYPAILFPAFRLQSSMVGLCLAWGHINIRDALMWLFCFREFGVHR